MAARMEQATQVLLERIEAEVSEGKPLREAIVMASLKRLRPIAAGELSTRLALVVAAVVGLAGIAAGRDELLERALVVQPLVVQAISHRAEPQHLDAVAGREPVRRRNGAQVGVDMAPRRVERHPDDAVEHLADGGATVTSAAAGARGSLGDASWTVLWPHRVMFHVLMTGME